MRSGGLEAFTLDPDSGRLLRDGAEVCHFTPRQADVMALLMRVPGRTISRDRIMTALYESRPDPPYDGIVGVLIHGIRRRLRGSGLRVLTNCGYGWELREG